MISRRYGTASPSTEKAQWIYDDEEQPSDLMFDASLRGKSKDHPRRFACRDVIDVFGIAAKVRQTKRNPIPCSAGLIRDLERQRNLLPRKRRFYRLRSRFQTSQIRERVRNRNHENARQSKHEQVGRGVILTRCCVPHRDEDEQQAD